MKATLLALTSILALSLSACSSSDDGGTTPKKDAGADSASEAGGDTGSPDTGSTTDTGGGGDEACAAESTAQACITCCAENHMDGYNTYVSTIIACTCKDTTCKTECASTLCASSPKNPDATCNSCFSGSAAQAECGAALSSACTGDCAAFNTCANACPKT